MHREASGLKLALGDKAPYFSLPATDGKRYSLTNFNAKQALVVIFTCNHCPYARAYEERICELARTYQGAGAQFLAVCANDSDGYPEDDFAHMVERAKELKLPFPYLHDSDQSVAKAYDAACTPEVYLFDSEQKLRYHGRIDDNYQDPSLVNEHNLRDALDAVLAGEEPPQALTPAIGCSIKWK